MKPLSNKTVMCMSIAEQPSTFGTTLFNAAFAARNLDYLYKAFAVKGDTKSLREALYGMRALGVRGCGLSMPFKPWALRYMDAVDTMAQKIGAINTVVNSGGRLKGYNTDYFGALSVLRGIHSPRHKSAVLLGAGGVAMAICAALKRLQMGQVIIVAREKIQARRLARRWGFEAGIWGDHKHLAADLFINATPIGMEPRTGASPLTERQVDNYVAIMDVVIKPLETKLVSLGRGRGKQVLVGHAMSLRQAAEQFELYTGEKAPLKVMERSLHALLAQFD